MPAIRDPAEADFEMQLDVAIIGGGACGLCAALAAAAGDVEVAVFERDAVPLGTTSMSTGLVPAMGSRFQIAAGIEDTPQTFVDDVVAKTKGEVDQQMVLNLAKESAQTVHWLADDHAVPLSLVEGFTYPGHKVMRMHGTPARSGQELMGALHQAVENAGVPLVTNATVTELFVDAQYQVQGLRYQSPDGGFTDIGCGALILACCGFAGEPKMVKKYIPEIAEGVFHGHPGNKGDALRWGQALGASVADLHAYQGHAGLAKGYGIPILWPIIMEGGVQINRKGLRFSNEARGYSEQAVNVLEQPSNDAWTFYDERLHQSMLSFMDYQHALEVKAIKKADDLAGIAAITELPLEALTETVAQVREHCRVEETDQFGRQFKSDHTLKPPYYAVRVTGALFHTQGGLEVNNNARVLDQNGKPLPNLYAGGGAARGISGTGADGYLAGNGLLTATTLGRLAGVDAARLCSV